MDSRFSKYKFLDGKSTFNKTFDQLNLPTDTLEGNVITANSKFVAVSIFVLNLLTSNLILYLKYRCHGK